MFADLEGLIASERMEALSNPRGRFSIERASWSQSLDESGMESSRKGGEVYAGANAVKTEANSASSLPAGCEVDPTSGSPREYLPQSRMLYTTRLAGSGVSPVNGRNDSKFVSLLVARPRQHQS